MLGKDLMSASPRLPPLKALRAFETVARLGNIRKAAVALAIDHTVVSRHLRILQDWLGVKLVNTSRQGASLTPAGRQYADRISIALNEIANASADLQNAHNNRQLVVWCIPGFATNWLLPRLSDFSNSHPDIDIVLRPTEAIPDFDSNEADAKIHYGPLQTSGLTCKVLTHPRVYAVASPDWIASHTHVCEPVHLLDASLIHEDTREQWRDWFLACGIVAGTLRGPRLWHANLAIEAAIHGQGVALANEMIAGAALDAGQLGRVTSAAPTLDPYVLITKGEAQSAKFHAFRNWLERALANASENPGEALHPHHS
jgi:LysR family transcriptional regulator, glycine cleavage system transcriptional activator